MCCFSVFILLYCCIVVVVECVVSSSQREEIYLAELFARKNEGSGVHFSSMHPGWADTPGVQTSLPDFYSRFKDRLRTSEQGADTIVWLAISDRALTTTAAAQAMADQGSMPSSLFYFDRRAVNSHLAFAMTASSPEEVEQLWNECTKHTTTTATQVDNNLP